MFSIDFPRVSCTILQGLFPGFCVRFVIGFRLGLTRACFHKEPTLGKIGAHAQEDGSLRYLTKTYKINSNLRISTKDVEMQRHPKKFSIKSEDLNSIPRDVLGSMYVNKL